MQWNGHPCAPIHSPSRYRVIDELRKLYPGKWSLKFPGTQWWEHESGMYVMAHSEFAPQWAEDDTSFRIIYVLYRIDHTNETILHHRWRMVTIY